jgi:L-histidine N-alpha-methyltransferase
MSCGSAAGAAAEQVAAILGALRLPSPRISQVYLYDTRGSEIYEEIVEQPEYYLPKIETEILRRYAAQIIHTNEHNTASDGAGAAAQLVVELGAGVGDRTGLLLRALPPDARCVYAPVDVSSSALKANEASFGSLVAARGGALRVHPLVGMFEQVLPEAARLVEAKRGEGEDGRNALYLFLGSSLGNFSDAECVALFTLVAGCMHAGDRFVVGVDTPHSTRKPAQMIHAAYNDSAGVTAKFTLNALRHVNTVAGTDFDWESGWRHVAEYDTNLRAIVTHLESLRYQTVHSAVAETGERVVLRCFAPGERIFMETSRKFDRAAIATLAAQAVRCNHARVYLVMICVFCSSHESLPDRVSLLQSYFATICM